MSDDVCLFPPPDDLAPFIECYWSWTVLPQCREMDAILPDAAPELIVHFDEPPERLHPSGSWIRQPRAFLFCSAFQPVQIATDHPIDMFAVRFRPWGVGVFSEAPLSEMIDTEALPEDVFGTNGPRLIEALSLAPDTDGRIEAANQAFRAMLPQSARADRATALSAHIAGGTVRSGDIANGLGISERSFRRLWRSMTGIEHRNFATLMRFHRAIAMVDEGISLSAVAAECGYSDQPHMAREVKRISGLSPAQLKKRLGEDVYGALYKDRPASPWRTS